MDVLLNMRKSKRKPWHRKRGWADKWAKKYNMRKTKGGVWVPRTKRKTKRNCGCGRRRKSR